MLLPIESYAVWGHSSRTELPNVVDLISKMHYFNASISVRKD